jgi:hypothetical protein
MESLQRLVTGNFEPAAADALWAIWPDTMARFTAETVATLSSPGAPRLSLPQRAGLSLALRIPLDGLLRPEAISALQTAYADADQDTQKSAQGSVPNSGPQGGRPPAVEQTRVQQMQDHSNQA